MVNNVTSDYITHDSMTFFWNAPDNNNGIGTTQYEVSINYSV